MLNKSFYCLPAILLCGVWLKPEACKACTVPVFRYALEKWQPDKYEVLLFHRGALTAEQSVLLQRITGQDDRQPGLANVRVTQVDLDANPSAEHLAAFEPHSSASLPFMVVRTPGRSGPPSVVRAESFSQQSVDSLLDSPLRKEIAERILRGDSVVWILLESGNKEQDDAAFTRLTLELDRLQKTIKLPELAAEDAKELGIESGSVKLAFSAIRLARNDPSDQFLADMLLRVEPDLLDEEFRNKTMAFPVFGRGRALHALVGDGVSAEMIEDASRFLTGECQCTVKAENPGVDLLMAVDWDGLVEPTPQKETELPPLAGLAGFAEPAASAESKAGLPDQQAQGDSVAALTSQTSEGMPAKSAGPASSTETSPSVATTDNATAMAVANKFPGSSDTSGPAMAAAETTQSESEKSPILRNVLLVVAAVVLIVFAGSLLIGKKQPDNG